MGKFKREHDIVLAKRLVKSLKRSLVDAYSIPMFDRDECKSIKLSLNRALAYLADLEAAAAKDDTGAYDVYGYDSDGYDRNGYDPYGFTYEEYNKRPWDYGDNDPEDEIDNMVVQN
jgi:hypothetical protein